VGGRKRSRLPDQEGGKVLQQFLELLQETAGLRAVAPENPALAKRPVMPVSSTSEKGGIHMNETDEDTLCRSIVEAVGDAGIFADLDGIIRLMRVRWSGFFSWRRTGIIRE